MIRRHWPLLTALALIVATPHYACATLHAGDLAPDFHKVDLDGNTQTLFQYRGKVVFLFLMGWN